ncbi:MAG: endonuclease/exonuclease/phosphatase family protein [Planctomycetes bacterium]|nr:endonuclease/exonuclease/phosphatase family protein [Planctomycetota bacterium]
MRCALSLLLLFTLASCQGVNQTTPTDTPSVVVLSYNIHHGEGNDGVFDLQRLADVIRDSNADLVALQEVDVKTDRANGVNQATELARLTGMHCYFGRSIHFSNGEYGDAVLSRWRIEVEERIPLPAAPNHEKRVAVAITVTVPSTQQKIRFVSTHLDHTEDPADRIAQAKALCGMIFPGSDPTILAGDLNAQPGSAPIQVFEQYLESAAPVGLLTFPAEKPVKQIDWIFLTAENEWKVHRIATIDEKIASDHLPLLAEISLLN